MGSLKLVEVRFLLWPDVALSTLIGLLYKVGINVGSIDWNAVKLRGGLTIFLDASPEMDKLISDAKRKV